MVNERWGRSARIGVATSPTHARDPWGPDPFADLGDHFVAEQFLPTVAGGAVRLWCFQVGEPLASGGGPMWLPRR